MVAPMFVAVPPGGEVDRSESLGYPFADDALGSYITGTKPVSYISLFSDHVSENDYLDFSVFLDPELNYNLYSEMARMAIQCLTGY
jgi:hypothetical protein